MGGNTYTTSLEKKLEQSSTFFPAFSRFAYGCRGGVSFAGFAGGSRFARPAGSLLHRRIRRSKVQKKIFLTKLKGHPNLFVTGEFLFSQYRNKQVATASYGHQYPRPARLKVARFP